MSDVFMYLPTDVHMRVTAQLTMGLLGKLFPRDILEGCLFTRIAVQDRTFKNMEQVYGERI